MKRRLYVLLALVLIIGAILWVKAALMVYAGRYLKPGYVVLNVIVCLLVVLIGVLIFKAIKDNRLS